MKVNVIKTEKKTIVTEKSGKYYLFQHLNPLIPTCKAGIWTTCIGYRNKHLGFHKARKVYQFMWTKSHYSSSARSWRYKQFSYAEITLL